MIEEVSEDTKCYVCHKKIGNNDFVVDFGKVFHYWCYISYILGRWWRFK
jgi:hypothetical protein